MNVDGSLMDSFVGKFALQVMYTSQFETFSYLLLVISFIEVA